MKDTQRVFNKGFSLFIVAEMFLGVALFLEAYSVQKIDCIPGRLSWLADKSKRMFGF